jgi:hypothetical protein
MRIPEAFFVIGRPLQEDLERAATQTVWVRASPSPGRV